MEVESWHQVKEILELAIEQPLADREMFIAEKCSGDAALQSKVSSLVHSYERIGSFMEDGAIPGVADTFTSPEDELRPGEHLGRYSIVKLLGEGGMGKVYLADDPDLHRPVAIKVLKEHLNWYEQARHRLIREARSAARLDHANICSIYEIADSDERSFIVMQYIEGETLGDIMSHGGLSARESIRIAIQIVDALGEAHSHNIIHRDIKPANVIINQKHQAKVLDFGLAKSIEPHEKNGSELSSAGAVMGTVPYMSPEQLRGYAVDGRSDIFSFGVLFYEMVSGRQPFGRDNNAETIAAIMNDEPDLSVIPHRFRRIVQRSLMKKAADRYQNIAELTGALRGIANETQTDTAEQLVRSKWSEARRAISTAIRRYFPGATGGSATPRAANYRWQDSDSDARTVSLTEPVPLVSVSSARVGSFYRRPLLWVAIALVVTAAVPTVLFWLSRPGSSDLHAFDSLRSVSLVSWKSAAGNLYTGYSASHSGKMIAYSSTENGTEAVYIKQTSDGAEARVTKDDWKNSSPIWSPDDQHLAYVSVRGSSFGIYTIAFLGGESSLVTLADQGILILDRWSDDGSTIFYELNGNLFKFDLNKHEASQVTHFEPSRSIIRDFDVSPDESQIVYCDKVDNQFDLWIMSLKDGQPLRLTNDPETEERPLWYTDNKHVVYSVTRGGHEQISVVYLDRRPPEQITRGEGEHHLIALSADGDQIFYLTLESRSDVWRINLDSNQEVPVAAEKDSEFWSDVSPDGKSVVYQINSATRPESAMRESTIATKRIDSQVPDRSVTGYDPKWLPDSRHISFLRWQGLERRNALWTLDTVSGEERLVVESGVSTPSFSVLPYNRAQIGEYAWSPDGLSTAFVYYDGGASNIGVKSNRSNELMQVSQNNDSGTILRSPEWSPDNQTVAFTSFKRSKDDMASGESGVWVAKDGVSKKIYSTTENLRFLGWSKKGSLLYEAAGHPFGATASDVSLIEISLKGDRRSINTLSSVYPNSLTLAADRETLGFTVRNNDRDNVWTASIFGGKPKSATNNSDPKVFFGSLAWSPDGKNIFFDKQVGINTISIFENFKIE